MCELLGSVYETYVCIAAFPFWLSWLEVSWVKRGVGALNPLDPWLDAGGLKFPTPACENFVRNSNLKCQKN